jgi:uncharacterized damage-inducible protein DinB
MNIIDSFVAQLERESAISRRTLERVPEGRSDWKPHTKSMPLGYLATLVAFMPSWIDMVVGRDELDLRPKGGQSMQPKEWTKRSELLQLLDDSAAQAKSALRGTNEEHLLKPWRLLAAGKVVDESPRHVVIADTFSHVAHHRGQLTVYLRLNEIPVPSVYGPTADEPTF